MSQELLFRENNDEESQGSNTAQFLRNRQTGGLDSLGVAQ